MADADIISIAAHTRGDGGLIQGRCKGTTATGSQCRNRAVTVNGFCRVHAREEVVSRPAAEPSPRPEGFPDDLIAFLRRRLAGEYEVDDFGYDPELTREILMPIVRPLYERYFRVRTYGVERIPDDGAAMLVANHSGTIPLDSVMMQYAVGAEHPAERLVRCVGADLVWRSPLVGPLARKTGNVVACDEDAYELLRRGELMGVFPEGFKGVGKGWRERYKLQRFGRGGYIEVALRTKTPIVPVAIVGAEEAYPMVGDARAIAQLFGFPYFPLTLTFPWLGPLGLLPLPSRWVIEFGEPIPMDDYPDDAADDPMLIFEVSDRVRDTIQQMLYANLARRGSAFL